MGTLKYSYKFIFPDGKGKVFDIALNSRTMGLVTEKLSVNPPWTKLSFCKCESCPLDESKHKYCPAALSMVNLIDFCKDMPATQHARVSVESADRTYIKNVSLQDGLSSLVGIYMVTGGCPVLAVLKTMVRFHLPFAAMEETAYRVFSMYMLAQYFLAKKGFVPDWKMEKLPKIYRAVSTVNSGFCERLRSIAASDSSVNAVIVLDALGSFIEFSIKRNAMKDIEEWFSLDDWSK
jgi:hypothetical protein